MLKIIGFTVWELFLLLIGIISLNTFIVNLLWKYIEISNYVFLLTAIACLFVFSIVFAQRKRTRREIITALDVNALEWGQRLEQKIPHLLTLVRGCRLFLTYMMSGRMNGNFLLDGKAAVILQGELSVTTNKGTSVYKTGTVLRFPKDIEYVLLEGNQVFILVIDNN